MSRIVVLDTNVLLADPNSVLSYPRDEIVIPETVLGELDKLKTARVDPDLRFRGREISRMLFELSEDGSLIDGVDIPDGGRLRVVPFDPDVKLPDGITARNSDDKIIATAMQVCSAAGSDCDVLLVTNDLNMLLKAQTLGVTVARYGEGVEGSFAKRFIIRPFQRYRVPLAILAIALAVFVAVLVLTLSNPVTFDANQLPTQYRELLTPKQVEAFEALAALERNRQNSEALLTMANFYYDAVANAQASGNQALVIPLSKSGIRYYTNYLKELPTDNDARADMASLLFYSGQTDPAIRAVGEILENDPNHVNANYNLGIFYLQGRRDLKAAADQMRKVIELTETDPNAHQALERARLLLTNIETQLGASGESTQGVIQ
jgi:Flp pilus assembly protein TadD/rRNA-processing protein FCF1